jgi:S-DNA-T family DNA segregation ATPase FtsK/SpoIIIE
LVIDDLDLVESRHGVSPLAPLVELLPYAAELGLSVAVSRRASGYGRAAFEPFLGQLLDLCDTGVVLSADPAEGAVMGGVRPRPLPPGRGVLVLRGQPAGEVQVAWLEAAADSPPGEQQLAPLPDPGHRGSTHPG